MHASRAGSIVSIHLSSAEGSPRSGVKNRCSNVSRDAVRIPSAIKGSSSGV
jgi:hypothetical protein